MNQLEQNITRSFKRAKSDIINLQNQVLELSRKQEELLTTLMETRDKNSIMYHRIKELKAKSMRSVPNRNKTHELVASKTGKKFHIKECPFAKNIRPKNRILFKSKTKALNEGLKACSCVTK